MKMKATPLPRLGGPVLVVLVALFTLATNPYRFDEQHGRWRFLPVMQVADAALFPGDAMVDAVAKYRSVFYDAATAAVRTFSLTSSGLERLLASLYALLVVCVLVVLLRLSLVFDKGLWLFALIGLWVSRPRSGILGGDGFFDATLTDREVGVLLALLAVCLVLRSRCAAAALVLSAAVFVHVLLAIHVFLCVFPAVLLTERRFTWKDAAGCGAFILSCGLWAVLFGPARLSSAEAAIFLRSQYFGTAHFTLSGQSALNWILLGGLMLLAFLANRRLGPGGRPLALLQGFALSGAACALTLSLLCGATGWSVLARLQPMRIFTLVTFFVYLLIMIAAVRARKEEPLLSAILLLVLGASSIHPLLDIALLASALLYILSPGRGRWRTLLEKLLPAGALLMAACILLALLSGKALHYDRVHDPVTSLAVVFVPALCLWWRALEAWRGAALLLLALCVYAIANSLVSIPSSRTDRAWLAIAEWCRQNSAAGDLFLTPPDTSGFRFYARRTPAAELNEAVIWVDPPLYSSDLERNRRVREAYRTGGACDLDALFALAQEWKAAYLIAAGPCRPQAPPLMQAGRYALYRVAPPASR